jgi:hypothetical protein
MKQIILEQRSKGTSRPGLCSGKLFLLWGCYGYAMLLLSRLAGAQPWIEAAVWTFGIVAGLALAVGTEGA